VSIIGLIQQIKKSEDKKYALTIVFINLAFACCFLIMIFMSFLYKILTKRKKKKQNLTAVEPFKAD